MPPAVEIDPRGDIHLHLLATPPSTSPTTYLACSRALSRASPVFDRMLHGSFAESKASAANAGAGEWVVDLSHGQPHATRLFLDMTHGRFEDVPRDLSVEELYEITVLTNYYDATKSLIPWAEGWMGVADEVTRGPGAPDPKVLWIAWELGRRDIFETVSRRMLMESVGPGFIESGSVKDVQTPPDIVERIDAIRLQTCQSLLNVFQEMADTLVVVDERVRWCRHHTWMGPHRCESMILGSMTFCLTRAGLWPIPDARDLDCSVLDLYGKLTGLIIHDIGREPGGEGVDHRECNPRAYLMGQVQAIIHEIPNPVTEFHVKYLEEQAKKLLR